MTARTILVSWPAAIALADANPRADVTSTGSGMSVHLPNANYVAIRPAADAVVSP